MADLGVRASFPPPPRAAVWAHAGLCQVRRRSNRGAEAQGPRRPPLPSHQPPGTCRQSPHARARRARVQVFPSPLRPRGPRLPVLSCRRHAQPGGPRLPLEEVQDDIGHGGGELEVEFRGGIQVVALREPGSDEQQEHGGSQRPTDAHVATAVRRRGEGRGVGSAGREGAAGSLGVASKETVARVWGAGSAGLGPEPRTQGEQSSSTSARRSALRTRPAGARCAPSAAAPGCDWPPSLAPGWLRPLRR